MKRRELSRHLETLGFPSEMKGRLSIDFLEASHQTKRAYAVNRLVLK